MCYLYIAMWRKRMELIRAVSYYKFVNCLQFIYDTHVHVQEMKMVSNVG